MPVGHARWRSIREDGRGGAAPPAAAPPAPLPPRRRHAPATAPAPRPARCASRPRPARARPSSASTSRALRGTGPGRRDHAARTSSGAAGGSAAPAPADRQRRACGRRSPRRWRARSGRSRTTTSATTIDMQRGARPGSPSENAQRPVTERLLPGVAPPEGGRPRAARGARAERRLGGRAASCRAPAIHVGVAISLRGGGLVAPALHDTDRQRLDELMRSFRDLVKRARAGTLRSSELSDPTITVTSLGEQGVETVFGVIYPPQVAIVGFGKIVRAALVGRRRRSSSRPVVDRDALRRPPRDRRPSRRALPRRRRPPAAGAGEAMTPRRDPRPPCCASSARSRPRPTSTRLDPDASLRDQLDLDSMDFLNFVIAPARGAAASTSRRRTTRSSRR